MEHSWCIVPVLSAVNGNNNRCPHIAHVTAGVLVVLVQRCRFIAASAESVAWMWAFISLTPACAELDATVGVNMHACTKTTILKSNDAVMH